METILGKGICAVVMLNSSETSKETEIELPCDATISLPSIGNAIVTS